MKTRDASLAGKSTTRVVHAFGTALAVGAVSALLLVQPTYAGCIQNFDSDPGWTRFNNPSESNDFGFRDSNLAGGNPGEAGGFFGAPSVPVWYGDESVGNFGGNDALSASGILNILSVEPDYNNNVFIGHFDKGGFEKQRLNGIGFQVLENGPNSFRIFYKAGTAEGRLFTIVGLDLTRTWSYNYDPSAGSFGSLTVSVSGPGGEKVTHFLTSDQRGSIGSIETFGLAIQPYPWEGRQPQAEMYFDNLSYTSSTCCPADLDGDGVVGPEDLRAVIAAWGNEGGPEDLDESGLVDIGDILAVLAAWGPCPEPTGACCLEDGTCLEATIESECVAMGGRYRGDGNPCPEICLGACCLGPDGCIEGQIQQGCELAGGHYHGDGTTCEVGCLGPCGWLVDAPFFWFGNFCDEDDSCPLRSGPDIQWEVTIPADGNWTFLILCGSVESALSVDTADCCGDEHTVVGTCGASVTVPLAEGDVVYMTLEPVGACGQFVVRVLRF